MQTSKGLKFSIVIISLLVASATCEKHFKINDVLEKWETDSLSAKIGDLYRSIPRFDIHFQRISSEWDPNDQTYYESVGILAAPLVIIGVLAFLIGILALLIKCCCYCCCSNKEKKFTGVKKSQVVFARLRFILVAVVVLAAGVACLAANFSIHQAMNRAVSTAYNTEQSMVGYLTDIEGILSQLNDTQDIANQLRPFIEQVNQTSQNSKEYKETINDVEDYRALAMYIFAGIATFIALLAIFSGLCSRHGAACIAVTAVLFAPLCWILAGTHLYAGVYIADMCPQIENYIKDQADSGSNDQAIISYYMDCYGADPLTNVSATAKSELAKAEYELAWAQKNHEPAPVIDAIEALVQDLTNLNNDLNALSNCNTTQAAWLEIKKDVCDNILDGVSLILFCTLVTALLYPFLTCCGFCVHSRRHTHVQGQYVALESYNVTINAQISPPMEQNQGPIATPVTSNPNPPLYPNMVAVEPPPYQDVVAYPTVSSNQTPYV